jgi:3-hydroxyacyl-[acyl-carrier-protein] dehydratase
MKQPFPAFKKTKVPDVGMIKIDQILQMIPHRAPFLFLDQVIDVVTGESAVGVKNVSSNEDYFRGYFPEHLVMPGVLLIEAMSQTASILILHTLGKKAENKLVSLVSTEKARFRHPVFPGDQLRIHITKIKVHGNIWKFDGKITVNDKTMVEAVIINIVNVK